MHKVLAIIAALILSHAAAQAAPLELKYFLQKAASANTSLKTTSYDEAIAREQVGVARSGYLPRVDLQAGYQAQLEPQAVKFQSLTLPTQDADFPFLSVSATQTLYDFGRTKAEVERTKHVANATKHLYQGSEQDLFLQVVHAYYGILEAQKTVAAAEDEQAQMLSHQRTAQALYEEGVVTRNDLLQAEVRVASSRQKVLSAKNAVENGWLALNYLSASPADFRGPLVEDVPPPPLPQGEVDFSRRGELLALKELVAADELAVKGIKTLWYPDFFLKLGLDYVKNSRVKEQAIMSGVVGLRVNLFDGLATTSRLRSAVKARARDEDRLRDLDARLKLELASARNDMTVAQERIKVSEKAIQQGMENLRITKDRYAEKVGTATDVVDAQTLLTQTRTDYFRSVFDLEVAAARVKRATGEL